MPDVMAPAFKLKVAEALPKDLGRGLVRMDPEDMKALSLETGDHLEIKGKRTTVGRAMPAYLDQRGHSRVQMDGTMRANAGTSLDQMVEIRKILFKPASQIVLAPQGITLRDCDLDYIGSKVDNLAVVAGDQIQVPLLGTRAANFKVVTTTPAGPVLINPETRLKFGPSEKEMVKTLSYEEIGGLKRELHRIREIIELPLRFPEVFERLGIDAPKGVLLFGPPGCGKTLIARAVAHETDAAFFSVNGPEIIHKFYGESEAHLRKIFEEASKKAPSIIFIDEIDSIAPRRDQVVGEVEKRVVAQLLALMDGLNRRQQVIVIAATNIPNSLDPALRRPGRFDREISISIPDRDGRKEILEIHSRGMPLANDVDMERLASITHGFVGADLEAFCREAAMTCLGRFIPGIDFQTAQIPFETLSKMEVHMGDFLKALQEVEPSAIREVFVEIPDVRWEDIGGLEQVRKQLIEAVEWPLKYADLYAMAKVKPPKGIILSGPPGCGKTLLAKAIANESQVNFISVKGPSLISKYVGDSEKGVREVFHKARQAAPCIVFFDEIDSLAPARGSGGTDSHVTERVISQLLTEMDGVEELNGVLVLAATNRLDLIDPALIRPGRFDVSIHIPPPNLEGREAIFSIGLRGRPLDDGIYTTDLAKETEGFTGAEIQAVCMRASIGALRDFITISGTAFNQEMKFRISASHMAQALRDFRQERKKTDGSNRMPD